MRKGCSCKMCNKQQWIVTGSGRVHLTHSVCRTDSIVPAVALTSPPCSLHTRSPCPPPAPTRSHTPRRGSQGCCRARVPASCCTGLGQQHLVALAAAPAARLALPGPQTGLYLLAACCCCLVAAARRSALLLLSLTSIAAAAARTSCPDHLAEDRTALRCCRPLVITRGRSWAVCQSLPSGHLLPTAAGLL
jgi:hypothetical protein